MYVEFIYLIDSSRYTSSSLGSPTNNARNLLKVKLMYSLCGIYAKCILVCSKNEWLACKDGWFYTVCRQVETICTHNARLMYCKNSMIRNICCCAVVKFQDSKIQGVCFVLLFCYKVGTICTKNAKLMFWDYSMIQNTQYYVAVILFWENLKKQRCKAYVLLFF